jgi:DUF4097 and DUF4098 domain-containing protein YvlB
LVTFCGCGFELGNWSQAKYERTVSQSVTRGTADTLDVATESGSIRILGAEVSECNIVARIVGHAPTEEEARELAEQVEIRAEPSGDTLKVRADQPDLSNNRSISIHYTITVPRQMSVLCDSDYGSLDIRNIQGKVKGRTQSGSVTAEKIQGELDLDTAYGSITCRAISGPTLLQSSSGSITIADLKGSAKIRTSYGSITCAESAGDSLDVKTSSGGITLSNTPFSDCVAETDYGSITARAFMGKAIKLHSSSGAVAISAAQADTIDLHTSYGRVEARRVTTGNLLADSGSGSIDIACSEACPAELKASAKTSYGSIDFTAPPQFSGDIRLTTEYGSIHTALPIPVSGRIDKKNMVGRIGEGQGTIRLETGSGSIDLK